MIWLCMKTPNAETFTIPCFSLRAKSHDGKSIVIKAVEVVKDFRTHVRLNIEVKVDGKVLFPMGELFVGLPFTQAVNGNFAKKLVVSAVAIRPEDTDADYFENYTPEQVAFVEANADMLTMKAETYK